jgi:mannose-1-phosphate guanylyltransferase/phosphomannomutase
MDSPAERVSLVTRDGVVLDPDTALHTLVELWSASSPENKVVGVPVSASTAVDEIAARHGCTVVRTGRSRRQLSNLALTGAAGFVGGQRGGYIFPEFLSAFDAVMTVGMAAQLLAADARRLEDVVAGLPEFHLRRASLFCPYGEKGTVMRAMAEATAGSDVRMTDGIKVFADDGWVLLLPHPVEPRVDLFAEGPDEASSEAMLERYAALVERTLADEE